MSEKTPKIPTIYGIEELAAALRNGKLAKYDQIFFRDPGNVSEPKHTLKRHINPSGPHKGGFVDKAVVIADKVPIHNTSAIIGPVELLDCTEIKENVIIFAPHLHGTRQGKLVISGTLIFSNTIIKGWGSIRDCSIGGVSIGTFATPPYRLTLDRVGVSSAE